MPKQPSKTSPKRKASSPRKKAAAVVNHSAARALVEDVLVLDGDLEATLSQVLSTAAYARHLEETVRQLTPKGKTCQEIDHESDKLRKAAVSGIKKQMKVRSVLSRVLWLKHSLGFRFFLLQQWRASCKHQGSPWVYDGICPEPDVFGAMFGIEGPPTWPRKMKRFSAEEFQEFVGTIRASAQWVPHNTSHSICCNECWTDRSRVYTTLQVARSLSS